MMDVCGRDGTEKIGDAALNEVERRQRQPWCFLSMFL
jgi:hypothetical protein